MIFTYLWQPESISTIDANRRFESSLKAQCDRYQSSWGIQPTYYIKQLDGIFIGQIVCDPGIDTWEPWADCGSQGIVWGGVCEEFLGVTVDSNVVKQILGVIGNSPEQLQDWDGWFSLISWDALEKQVVLTTACVSSPSLWCTEGPNGWAAGSHASLLLDLVAGKKRPSLPTLNLFLAYGYLYDNGSPFENVHRLPSRSQIVLSPQGNRKSKRYLSLAPYFQNDADVLDTKHIVHACAERLTERVRKQLKYSKQPRVLITGGSDSRCVLAAAKRAGYSGLTSSGGDKTGKDYLIGKRVANRLNLSHEHSGDRIDITKFAGMREKLKEWTAMSEGVETIRHATAYPDFFLEKHHSMRKPELYFHGMGSGFYKGPYYQNLIGTDKEPWLHTTSFCRAHEIMKSRAHQEVSLMSSAQAQLQENFDGVDRDLVDTNATVVHWLDSFFWQNRELQWGPDILSVKSPMFFAWTPLMDGELFKLVCGLKVEEKIHSQFIKAVAKAIQPCLADIEYDYEPGVMRPSSVSLQRKVKTQIKRMLQSNALTYQRVLPKGMSVKQSIALTQFWELTLFSPKDRLWEEFMTERAMRKVMYRNPNAEILWNALTIQLFYEVHCM